MAVTAVGFQGTVSDIQMATQLGGHHLPTVRSATDLLVSAVAGQRTVNVAAGVADSAFVKATNDGAAAGNIALAPPTSGGKWYAITVDRQWSPTNTVTLRGDDLAVSDANGTTPTTIPAGVLSALQTLPNQPGTSGSTAGQRQILAAVYVRAADATLTVFDLRAIRTGAGLVTVLNLHALAVLNATGQVLPGGVVTVGSFTSASGQTHLMSTWRRYGGQFFANGRITGSGTQTVAGLLTDISNLVQAYAAHLNLEASDAGSGAVRMGVSDTLWEYGWNGQKWIPVSGGGLAVIYGATTTTAPLYINDQHWGSGKSTHIRRTGREVTIVFNVKLTANRDGSFGILGGLTAWGSAEEATCEATVYNNGWNGGRCVLNVSSADGGIRLSYSSLGTLQTGWGVFGVLRYIVADGQ